MSKEITAYFKGRKGVCESVYQHDYGRVMVLDDIPLDDVFEAYFETSGEDESIPAIGQDGRVTIPNDCISRAGDVTVHIPINDGENDSEVEYVVKFRVIGRSKPTDADLENSRNIFQELMALLRSAINKWHSMEAVASTLPPSSEATAEDSDGTLTLGIPKGDTGVGIADADFDENNKLTLIFTDGKTATCSPLLAEYALVITYDGAGTLKIDDNDVFETEYSNGTLIII